MRSKKSAITELSKLASGIRYCIMKCLIYGDDDRISVGYDYWVDIKLTELVLQASNIRYGWRSKKFSPDTYDEILFDPLGNSFCTIQNNLIMFQLIHKYLPKVDITPDISKSAFFLRFDCRYSVCNMLSSKDNISRDIIQTELHSLLDRYCLRNN